MSSLPGKNDLDGSAPDTHPIALLLVDLINDFQYPGGEQLLSNAMKIAPCLKNLKNRARQNGVPVIYANDNFGRWRSNFAQLVERCIAPQVPGCKFVSQLAPDSCDYMILKPKHSAFFQTPLDVLLKHLGTERLILAGLSTNSCILFTAQDAYMRDLQVVVPEDGVTAITVEDHEIALAQIKSVIKADIAPCSRVEL